MAYDILSPYNGQRLADADLRGKMYYLVKITTTGVALCGNGQLPLGVLYNKPDINQPATVILQGAPKIMAGTSLAPGSSVACDANGKLKAAVAGAFMVGTTLEDASGDGVIVPVNLTIGAGTF